MCPVSGFQRVEGSRQSTPRPGAETTTHTEHAGTPALAQAQRAAVGQDFSPPLTPAPSTELDIAGSGSDGYPDGEGLQEGIGSRRKERFRKCCLCPSPKVSGWDRRPVKAGPELLGEGCGDARKQLLLPWDGLHVAWGPRAVPWARPWWGRTVGHSQCLFTWLCCTCSGV